MNHHFPKTKRHNIGVKKLRMDLFSFDLYLSLPKQYYNLLKKAEDLMRSQPRNKNCPTNSITDIFLEADGHFGPIKFINMCVPDSLLMAFYNCYIQFDHIKSLFNTYERLRAPMVFLQNRMYNEAKASWLFWTQLKVTKGISKKRQFVADAWSVPDDHLPMFTGLKVRNNNLRFTTCQGATDKNDKFKRLGTVHSMGFNNLNPLLILVDVHPDFHAAPPQYLDDDYYRPFELQFLLMSKKSIPHMIVGLNLFDRWRLYDDLKTSYDNFNPTEADFKEEFTIHWVGYVKNDPVPVGVAEEGHHSTVPFPQCESHNSKKEHID